MTLISKGKTDDSCIGRTCLKWSPDGSLSDFDKDLLVRRLCESDPEFSKSDSCRIHQCDDLSQTLNTAPSIQINVPT